MYELAGKVAIVTGAGGQRGIGRAIATRLAREGADVVITDVVKPSPAQDETDGWRGIESVAAEIEALGRRALSLYSDVTDVAQVRDMVERTVATFGKIDMLVCNAGAQPGGDRKLLIDVEVCDFDLVQRVNV
jgi:NAD(P)-dependent dehydrogenase (short-subunit alcohol dehydrogenase family)